MFDIAHAHQEGLETWMPSSEGHLSSYPWFLDVVIDQVEFKVDDIRVRGNP